MARRRGNPFRTSRLNRREAARWLAAALCALLGCLLSASVSAQQTSVAVVAPGNAAVTGFSGALPPAQIAPGDDPGRLTFIDLNGPSLRIVDLQHMGGPAAAQLVGAPKPFTFSAARSGKCSASRSTIASRPTSMSPRLRPMGFRSSRPARTGGRATSGSARRARLSCGVCGVRKEVRGRSGRSTARPLASACSPTSRPTAGPILARRSAGSPLTPTRNRFSSPTVKPASFIASR